MEGDKEAYLEEATKALRRQRKTIEDFEKEKRELERELRMSKSRKNARKDGENAAKLARLAAEQVKMWSMLQDRLHFLSLLGGVDHVDPRGEARL